MPFALLESLLALLFPERCAGCNAFGDPFCPTCRATLAIYGDDGRTPPAGLSAVWVGFVFDGPLRGAIHQLKYRRRRRVARPLAAMLAETLPPAFGRDLAVMAVPLHGARERERGYNQADELARVVAQARRLPLAPCGLQRVRATEQQARLDARGRRENMRGAFAWKGAAPPPARILMIDDVLTTGATMSACAEALRAAGTREVYGVAVARSRLDP